MSATWTSHLSEYQRRDERAQNAALIACAVLYMNAMQVSLSRGYTSGAFTTGLLAQSVEHSEPFLIGPAAWAIRIGTDVGIALAWELGFFSIFSQKHERVEKWRMTLVDMRAMIARRYAQVYLATMGA